MVQSCRKAGRITDVQAKGGEGGGRAPTTSLKPPDLTSEALGGGRTARDGRLLKWAQLTGSLTRASVFQGRTDHIVPSHTSTNLESSCTFSMMQGHRQRGDRPGLDALTLRVHGTDR